MHVLKPDNIASEDLKYSSTGLFCIIMGSQSITKATFLEEMQLQIVQVLTIELEPP